MDFPENELDCRFGALEQPSEIVSILSESIGNKLDYRLASNEGCGSIIPALEDESMEVDAFLSEPKLENSLEDNASCLELDDNEKRFKIEDFPCSDDLCRMSPGTLLSDVRHEAEESKCEFLDGMVQEVDEERSIHVDNNISIECANHLLDVEFTKKHSRLCHAYCEACELESLCSERLYHGLNENKTIPPGMPNSSHPAVKLHESNFGQCTFLLDIMSIRELHDAFKSTFGHETYIEDKQWLKRRIFLGLQNLVELENDSNLLLSGRGPSFHENEENIILAPSPDRSIAVHESYIRRYGSKTPLLGRGTETNEHVISDVMVSVSGPEKVRFGCQNSIERDGTPLSQKRVRKPTRRYIEESDVASRSCNGKSETSAGSISGKCSPSEPQGLFHHKEYEMPCMVSKQVSIGGSGLQIPSGYRVQRGRPRKNPPSLMGHGYMDYKDNRRVLSAQSKNCLSLESHPESHDMSDECVTTIRAVKDGARRKHHRLWTLSEVMKLVEGVTQHGVGRWTDIKRLLFSSSGHRTSVDLKDKWRNLLRASRVQMQNKEVEHRSKHASLRMPQAVLRQVRELAVMYPYPRERKPKLTRGRDASISRSGRILHRRDFS